MAITLEQRLTEQGVSPQDVSGIKPLLDNKTYRTAAEADIALAQDASDKANKLAQLTGAYDAEATMFLSATRAMTAIAKEFPEVADEVAQINKLLATAMSKVNYNPVPAPAPAVATAKTAATPIPVLVKAAPVAVKK